MESSRPKSTADQPIEVIRFACPSCGRPVKAPPKMAYRVAICPKCRRQVTVPGPESVGAEGAENATAPSSPQDIPSDLPSDWLDGVELDLPSNNQPSEPLPSGGEVDGERFEDLSTGDFGRWSDEVEKAPVAEEVVETAEMVDEPADKLCPYCAEKIAWRAVKCKHCGSMLIGQGVAVDKRKGFSWSRDNIVTMATVSAVANLLVGALWAMTIFGLIIAVPMFFLCYQEFQFQSSAKRMGHEEFIGKAKNLSTFEIVMGLFNLVSLVCGILMMISINQIADRSKAD